MHVADDQLLRFFAGEPDDLGRTYDEILLWDDERLELVHDYIQWIFPLPERSGANPWAPVLTQASISVIRSTPEMQQRLRSGYVRMLEFYGFSSMGSGCSAFQASRRSRATGSTPGTTIISG